MRRSAECERCREERRTRHRVLSDGGLKLLAEDTHEFTPTAVPNNDVRYEINKLRAQMFAKRRGLQLLWCPAKDRVTIDALREDCSLSSKKKDWLQRHDRQCGDLTSMLPFVVGLPLILMEHMDRSAEVRMLKGTRVFLHSMEVHSEDERAAKG